MSPPERRTTAAREDMKTATEAWVHRTTMPHTTDNGTIWICTVIDR
jgi:hypothetical protein